MFNYLKISCFHENVRLKVMSLLDQVDMSFLKQCPVHFEMNKDHLQKSVFCIYIKRFITVKNRMMDDEDKQRALEKKLRILKNK